MLPEWTDDLEQIYFLDLRHATVHIDVAEDQWSTVAIEGAPGSYGPEVELGTPPGKPDSPHQVRRHEGQTQQQHVDADDLALELGDHEADHS